MIMAKEDNLIRNSDLTPKERREKAARAGKASAEARRRKKTMREALEMLMFNTELPEALKARMKSEGIHPEDMNHQMAITRSLIAKAESGDVQAYNAICAMIGEKPADKLDMNGGLQNELVIKVIGNTDYKFPNSEADLDLNREKQDGAGSQG
jgi:hypothetical protein